MFVYNKSMDIIRLSYSYIYIKNNKELEYMNKNSTTVDLETQSLILSKKCL